MPIFSKITTFLHLPGTDRRVTIEALIWLGLARLAVLTLPFRWITPYMGQTQAVSPVDNTGVDIGRVKRIAQAIRRVSHHTPWDSN